MAHERRRFVPRVDYITSPGYGDGPGWRRAVGLTRGGPSAVITTMGIFRFDEKNREMVLASLHPGVGHADVQASTGWPMAVSPRLDQTQRPTRQELEAIRRFDPQGFWTGIDA